MEILTQPAILFFILGFVTKILGSEIHVPGLDRLLSLHLLLTIGLKAGLALACCESLSGVLIALGLGILCSFSFPFLSFRALGTFTKLPGPKRAVLASHYGSISIVTFVTCQQFLARESIPFDASLLVVAGVMEAPAILSGLILFRSTQGKDSTLHADQIPWREIFFHSSITLILGGLAIAFFLTESAKADLVPFFQGAFPGVLSIYMLLMGMKVASYFLQIEMKKLLPLLVFGIATPLVQGSIGVTLGTFCGLGVGGAVLFGTLCASASYIAVPAAFSMIAGDKEVAYAMKGSLGVTFPFNVLFGISLYLWLAQALH